MSNLSAPLNLLGSGGAYELTTSGSTGGYNYEGNSAINTIESGVNSQANTCFGGYAGQPNQILGLSGYRTISGGYDNVIGRLSTSVALDNCVASTISGGAHHRIRRPLNTSDKDATNTVVIPTNSPTAAYPTHGFIGGGSYCYIHNGDDGIIIGGFCNSIAGSVAIGGTNAYQYSGHYAFIGGGSFNGVNGTQSCIVGGSNNKIDSPLSAIGGGSTNIISQSGFASVLSGGTIAGGLNNEIRQGSSSCIGGGNGNKIGQASLANDWGSYCVIGGGLNNFVGTTAYSWGAAVLSGWNNEAQNEYATVVGGRYNQALKQYTTAIGKEAKANIDGAFTQASAMFSAVGDAQSSVLVIKAQTTTATAVTLTSMSAALAVPSDTAWAFRCLIVARATASDLNGAYQVTGLVKNNAGTVALVGTPTVTTLAEDTGAAAWNVTVAVSGVNLQIQGTGAASTTINWVGRLELSEVTG